MKGLNTGGTEMRTYSPGSLGFYSWNVPENRAYGDDVISFIFDIPPDELALGAPIERFILGIQEADRPRIAKAIHTAIVTGERYEADYHIVHRSGLMLHIAANGCCLRDATGTPSIYTGTATIMPSRAEPGGLDPLELHCRAALGLATKRRHSLAARYLSSALNVLGKQA